MLKPGQVLFEYKIVRILGQGGFGAVYEAQDQMLGRQVAIKQLRPEKLRDDKAVKRFMQEARVIASLEHPNVITVHALRGEGQRVYMVMEYLAGGTLRHLVEERGPLPVQEAVQLTIGICDGLAKLHQQGIIHRDIKPENILLTTDGRPKVIDFGIAHVPEAAGGYALTQAGFQPSTLLYSSPEQVVGLPLDARSDVYQIGELLYYMLLGHHYIDIEALEKKSLTQQGNQTMRSMAKMYTFIEEAICELPPAGLQKLWREVGSMAGVVAQSLAKKPEDRFFDAAEFAATLRTLNLNQTLSKVDEKTQRLQSSRGHNNQGLAYVSTRNYEQAIIEYSKALTLDPNYAEAYNNRSIAHLLMNNYAKAVYDSIQALKLAPDFVVSYVNLGIAYTGMREYEQGIKNYKKALELDPDNLYAHFNLGNVNIWMGQARESIPHFSRVIEMNPEFVAAYVNRGIVYTELGQYKRALDDFNKAIALNPEYSYAYYNRANAYRELSQHQAAVEDYTTVISLNPEHTYAYENRADAYTALGEEDKATEDYTRLVTGMSSIHPRRFTVARSMLMPAIPLDFLA